MAIYIFQSVIRGHHISKTVWTLRFGEELTVEKEADNAHDRHAVAVLKGGVVVGHAPREISKTFWHFLTHQGEIRCEVTGRRKFGKGLEVPCFYKCTGKEKMVLKLKELLSAT